MINIAKKLANVKPSQTKAIAQIAANLNAQGREVISLSLGEPDYDTPMNIIEAGERAMREGHTRYTSVPGILPLREAICDKLAKDNNLRYTPDQITVGTGAKQVLYNALVATLDKGDEVLIPTPCWVSYPDMVSLAGGTPIFLECRKENSYLLDPEELEAKITDRTKWIIFNSPNNPSGAVYQEGDLKIIAELLRRYPHVSVMSDDVYEKFTYPGTRFATMAEIAPDLADRCLVVNSLSKTYCMTGWRVGYGAGPAHLIKTMNLVQSQTTSHACSISQVAAIEALNGPQEHIAQFIEDYYRRIQFTVERINKIDGLNCSMPSGSFYVFVDCSDLIGKKTPEGETIANDIELGMHFMESAGVAVVPGSAFFAPGHFRISCAASLENLSKGIDRIEASCAELK